MVAVVGVCDGCIGCRGNKLDKSELRRGPAPKAGLAEAGKGQATAWPSRREM